MKIHMLIISLLLFCTASFAQNGVRILPRETVLDLKWGDRPDEIGLIQGEMNWGPSSFLVNKNSTIYILDSANHRMSVFSNNGEYLRSFPVIGYGETCWGEDDTIYLNYGGQQIILEYAIDGELLSKFEYSFESNLYASNLIVRQGIFYIWNYKFIPLNYEYSEEDADVKVFQTERVTIQSNDAPRNIGAFSNNKYLIENNIYYSEHIDGEKTVIFENSSLSKSDRALFLQEDNKGNKYFLILSITDNIRTRTILVLDTNLLHIATIGPLCQDQLTEIDKEIYITQDGTVYQIHTNKSGVQLFKWSM